MGVARNLIAGTLLVFAAMATPAAADTTNTPPGNPCLKNNGNPCNGNNGNLGEQGNVHDKVKIDKKPPPIDLAMPAVTDRGVFISQVGDANQATVIQTVSNGYAKTVQDGISNVLDATQSGTGTAYLEAAQRGTTNFARLQQSGSGQNVLYVDQNGTDNWLWSSQEAVGALHNGARLTQTGDNNDLMLYQSGSDNLAVLTQEGDNNGMTAAQLGEGNRLTWFQQGSNLTDLQITQVGGAENGGQLLITQTNIGPGE